MFPNILTNNKTKTPCISHSELVLKLEHAIFNNDYDIDNIELNTLNNHLKMKCLNDLLRKRTRGKKIGEEEELRIIRKIDETGCYLFINKR